MSMTYITEGKDGRPGSGPRKYYDQVATGYDKKRQDSPKWQEEQRIIEEMMGTLKTGSTVLDCPVGTGRFIPYAELRKFKYLGVDISHHMLAEASKKIGNPEETLVELMLGSILGDTDTLKWGNFKDEFDCSLMIRMTRWLSPDECMTAMHNLMEVTKDTGRIIFTYREDGPHARPSEMWLEIFANTGWNFFKNEHAHEHSYRVAQIRKS
jgi:ubiquinone/menaquinone biosynthesis C-methylase UbiE